MIFFSNTEVLEIKRIKDKSVSEVILPDFVTSIGDGVFYNCSSLTSAVMTDSIMRIGYGAFYGCSSLTSIKIPDSVTSIGDDAFEGCSSLVSVTIGKGVTRLGDSMFYSCSNLTNINYNGTIAEWNKIEKDRNWDYNTGNYTVYCTDGTVAKDGTVTYY